MAKNIYVNVITGDWMSEANMNLRDSDKCHKLANREISTGSSLVAKGYEPYSLEELDPAISWLTRKGTKIAVNVGASDVHGLAEAVKELIKKHGVSLKVGGVNGDDVTEQVLDLYKKASPSSTCQPISPSKNGATSPSASNATYLTGLDIEEKAAMIERQTKARMGKYLDKFSCITWAIS